MISKRLIRHIQDNAGKLTADLVHVLRESPRTPAYRDVPSDRLIELKGGLYEQLGRWLSARSKFALERRYRKLGRERYLADIPLSQHICALNLTKSMLLDFICRSTPGDPSELGLQHELVLSISEFFDEASYFASAGYEDACRATLASPAQPQTKPPKRRPLSARGRKKAEREHAEIEGEVDFLISRAGDIGEASG